MPYTANRPCTSELFLRGRGLIVLVLVFFNIKVEMYKDSVDIKSRSNNVN